MLITTSWRYQQPYGNPSFLMSFLLGGGCALPSYVGSCADPFSVLRFLEGTCFEGRQLFAVVHSALLKRV